MARPRCSRLVTSIGITCLLTLGSHLPAATLSGTVVIPASPTGSAPQHTDMSVRVEGTTLSAPVDVNSGEFTLADVPTGNLTLMLVEAPGQDVFTQASKRTAVDVNGDVSGISFDLEYHWQLLAGYPSVWQTAGYDDWQTFFVSEQVGFILFRISGPPERTELYATADGGATWHDISDNWVKDSTLYTAGNQLYPSADMRMFFADALHGVVLASTGCLPCGGCNVGFFRTADGGATWTTATLPLVDTAYAVTIDRFTSMSATHWIAAGTIGCNVQGYSSGFHSVIWETADAGATWQVADSFEEAIGCTGLAANSDGDAIVFRTPYGNGPRKISLRSAATGTWTTTDDGSIVTNSGYGPADVVMIDDVVWVTSTGGSLPDGLYRSDQAGAAGTWTLVGSGPQYMSVANSLKMFGLFGGPARVSYDGGATWLHQSGGGGLCCHGNDVFAFSETSAVWRDRGAGDPDGISSIYRYYEPALADFEVLPGVDMPDGYAQPGEINVPMASLKLTSYGPVSIQVNSLTVDASGTGNDATDLTAVRLWLDVDADGLLGPADTLLGTGTHTLDDGSVVLSTGGNLILTQLVPQHVLITVDVAAAATMSKTFVCTVASANITAQRTDTQESVAATAPAAQTLAGRTLTSAETVLADDFGSGLSHWLVGTEDPEPDAGYGWQISDAMSTSPSSSAYIHEDRNHEGWNLRHYLTLAEPVNLSDEGEYYLAFNELYSLEPSPLLHVQSSTDGGSTWQTIRTFGNWEWNNTGGVYVQRVYDVSSLAGQSAVLIRFQLDWTSGWYFNATWSVDDVRIYRLPPALPDDETDPQTDPTTDPTSDPPSDSDTPDDSTSTDTDTTDEDTTGGTTNPGGPDEDTADEDDSANDGENSSPPPIPTPACGFGLAEAALATMTLLLAANRRRRF